MVTAPWARSKSMSLLAGVLAVCLAVIMGCGDGDKTTGPADGDPDPHRKTGPELLAFYAYAIEHEDIDMYEQGLHDDFIYVFPVSVADSLGLPPENPWWGKTAEVSAMAGLFRDTTITRIEFEFTDVGTWVPAQIEISPGEFISGVFTRTVPVTRLTVEEPGKEPRTLVFDASYLDISIVRDPKFPGEDLWVIARIEEVLKNPL